MLQIRKSSVAGHLNLNIRNTPFLTGWVLCAMLISGCASSSVYHAPDSFGHVQRGIASWYGPGFHGKLTANGERFDMHAMTAAHKTLPMNSLVHVKNIDTGQTIQVRINDRGPFIEGRIIDLSFEAARRLDIVQQGTARVELRMVSRHSRPAKSVAYWVQLASFSEKKVAEEFSSTLAVPSKLIRLVKAEVSDDTWFRVQMGPFATMREADTATQRFTFDLDIEPFIVKVPTR